jgi:hypothetical protein
MEGWPEVLTYLAAWGGFGAALAYRAAVRGWPRWPPPPLVVMGNAGARE